MPHDVFGEDPSFQVAEIGNLYGTHAARPGAAGVIDGIFYVETDTNSVFQAQASAWVLVDTLTTADVISVFTRTGAISAQTGDYAVAQVTGAAPLASPSLSGTPTAPTATALTNTTQVATTAYTDSAVGVETSARTTAVALKAPLASPTLTGTPAAPTAASGTNTTQIATTAYVQAITNGVHIYSGAGNPNSNVAANRIGDFYADTTNGVVYQASAADNSHWNIMNGAGFTIQAGAVVGVLFTNNDTDDPPLYLNNANSTGPQLRLGGINFYTNAGNPNAVIAALAIGDLCSDKTNGALYIAQAADNSHWVAL